MWPGEDAGGAHGSNRLGGNGVANSTVYGGVAGEVMGRDLAGHCHCATRDPQALEAEVARALAPLSRAPAPIQPLRRKLQDAMWEDVGVMRTATGLARAGLRASPRSPGTCTTLGVDAMRTSPSTLPGTTG